MYHSLGYYCRLIQRTTAKGSDLDQIKYGGEAIVTEVQLSVRGSNEGFPLPKKKENISCFSKLTDAEPWHTDTYINIKYIYTFNFNHVF